MFIRFVKGFLWRADHRFACIRRFRVEFIVWEITGTSVRKVDVEKLDDIDDGVRMIDTTEGRARIDEFMNATSDEYDRLEGDTRQRERDSDEELVIVRLRSDGHDT